MTMLACPGMLLRRDERLFKVATHSTPDASVFEEVPAMLRSLAGTPRAGRAAACSL